MARKNTVKTDNSGGLQFDSRTKAVMAEFSQDNVKEKVKSVSAVVPGKSKNEIVLVLQYYDYNVEKAIQAYLEGDAKAALTEWHFSGNKAPNKKRRNRKKSAAGKQTNESDTPQPSQNGHVQNHIGAAVTNGVLENGLDPVVDLSGHVSAVVSSDVDSETNHVSSSPLPIDSPSDAVPTSSNTDIQGDPSPPVPQPQRQYHQHHLQHRQRTHSGSHSHNRPRTASERSTSSGDRPVKHKIHGGLEKSSKDLHRQTVSLERLRMVLNEEVDKTYKRIKVVFDEMRTCLNNREVDLMSEMVKVKADANNTYASRQKMAADLKVRIDRSESMNDQELAELRADIKHFVSERKIDEDIGRTTRFLYDSDFLKEEIGRFGEVVPVKSTYSTRRPSVSSIASGGAPEEPLSPVTPVQTMIVNNSSHVHSENLDVTETHEMAELQKRLKDSLNLQGLHSETESRPSTAQSSQSQVSTYRDDYRRNRRRRPQRDSKGPTYREGDRAQYSGDGGSNYASRTFTGTSPTIHIGRQSQTSRGGGRGRGRGSDYRGGRGGGRPRSPRKEGPQGYRQDIGPRGDNARPHYDKEVTKKAQGDNVTRPSDGALQGDNRPKTQGPESSPKPQRIDGAPRGQRPHRGEGLPKGDRSPRPHRSEGLPKGDHSPRPHRGEGIPKGDSLKSSPKSQESERVYSSPEKSKQTTAESTQNSSNTQA